MNILRGMFRLWLLGAGLWVAFWGSFFLLVWRRSESGMCPDGECTYMFALLFGPPLVVLIIGRALIWALRGFLPDSSARSPPQVGGRLPGAPVIREYTSVRFTPSVDAREVEPLVGGGRQPPDAGR